MSKLEPACPVNRGQHCAYPQGDDMDAAPEDGTRLFGCHKLRQASGYRRVVQATSRKSCQDLTQLEVVHVELLGCAGPPVWFIDIHG